MPKDTGHGREWALDDDVDDDFDPDQLGDDVGGKGGAG